MIGSVKDTAAWRFARGIKRAVVPPRSPEPLPPVACRGSVSAVSPPVALEVASLHSWMFRIQNQGGLAWPCDGPNPVQLRGQWKTYRGTPFGEPFVLAFPRPVFPGEPQDFLVPVATPPFVGDFVLHVELYQPLGGVFSSRNRDTKPIQIAVPVLGRRAADIDYHEVYRTADLKQNHWWVVGAYHSKDQYEASKADRRGMLIKCGLTPESRVLDVGCGTGQMADALKDYLTDSGAYYGTDIGKEAIDFCTANFARKNFIFRHGEMTKIPFATDEGPFDLAIYFSVFTHTFVDESALLLAETKRLLKSTGRIVADVIVSDLIERCAGNRGEMLVNKEHFLRLSGTLGFESEVIGRWPWNSQAERLMVVFRNG